MLKKTSRNLRALILLQITKEMIKHSGGGVFELENVIEVRDIEAKERVKELMRPVRKRDIDSSFKEGIGPVARFSSRGVVKPKRKNPFHLRIREPRLPRRFQYLKPTPTNTEIDIGKLNDLVKDPMVRVIACNGPDENIVVRGSMGRKKTDIVLNKEELNSVIEKFSQSAKIPIEEGVFRVVVGRLILLAIISQVVDSKFIIKKMGYGGPQRR